MWGVGCARLRRAGEGAGAGERAERGGAGRGGRQRSGEGRGHRAERGEGRGQREARAQGRERAQRGTTEAEGKYPFSLDSKEPQWDKFQDYLKGVVRFAHGFVFAPQNFFIGWGRLTACMLYKERTPKTNLRGSQSGGYLLSHNIPQCSTIGDAVSLPCALAPLRSALSRARALSRAPQARTPPPAPRL